MKTNQANAYTQALGALKLIPIFLNCPGVISRATLIGASTDAVQLLESMPVLSTDLAEVFRCVNNVIQDGQVAYVTPTNSPEYPFGAVVADTKGQICAAAMGLPLVPVKCFPGLLSHITAQAFPLSDP